MVEGAGLHACEYMTNGTVIILGKVQQNVGAGMTGGVLYSLTDLSEFINPAYLPAVALDESDKAKLRPIIEDFVKETSSELGSALLASWNTGAPGLFKYMPIAQLKRLEALKAELEAA